MLPTPLVQEIYGETMTAHAVKWTAPSPLWSDMLTTIGADKSHFGKPTILRFADDAFMDQFLAVLERSPTHIYDFVARPETWQEPAPTPSALSMIEPVGQESKLARKLKRLRVSEERFSSDRTLKTKADSKPLKLFHPAHQRFYLITASLVCGPNGLTDHKIDAGHQERVGFIVRRLLPPGSVDPKQDLPASDPSGWDEYALVTGTGGSGWQKFEKLAGQGYRRLLTGEEILALFPVHYTDDDERKRRVLAGVVPVGKREAYLGATRNNETDQADSPNKTRPKTARVVLFRTQVAEPWKSLIQHAETVRQKLNGVDIGLSQKEKEEKALVKQQIVKTTREQMQVASWYILLDFAKYLQKYLGKLWEVVLDAGKGETDLESQAERNLFRALINSELNDSLFKSLAMDCVDKTSHQKLYPDVQDVKNLRDVLRILGNPNAEWQKKLDQIEVVYERDKKNTGLDWPGFLFPLADPELIIQVPNISEMVAPLEETDEVDGNVVTNTDAGPTSNVPLAQVDKIVALVARALPRDIDEQKPPPPLPLAAQKVFDHREGWFVIRCVYERPNCGPLHPAEVSESTEPFQMAGFFDPDAPARPIRIPLPIDTSPAGLRKFDKNTAFMISDMLCGQIKRAKGLSLGDLVLSVLPWPFHKDLPTGDGGPCKSGSTQFGMICSLSIPIITICAMILLMIIVSLFDMIFRWIPYFIMCFPLPGFKGKKPSSGGA